MTKKRDLFSELVEGFEALKDERVGKVTLRQLQLEVQPIPAMNAEQVRKIREKLRVSQPVFAQQLRIAPRTVANWEQGVSKPNSQAVILLRLVDRHPELLDLIAAL